MWYAYGYDLISSPERRLNLVDNVQELIIHSLAVSIYLHAHFSTFLQPRANLCMQVIFFHGLLQEVFPPTNLFRPLHFFRGFFQE